MYRQILIFLLVWPLLLPQGVCVCDWFGDDCEACVSDEAEVRHDKEAAILPGHTCHRHTTPGHPSDDLPRCPAKAGYGLWRSAAAERPAPVTGPLLITEVVADRYCPSFPIEATPPVGPTRSLFLTLLNLRI